MLILSQGWSTTINSEVEMGFDPDFDPTMLLTRSKKGADPALNRVFFDPIQLYFLDPKVKSWNFWGNIQTQRWLIRPKPTRAKHFGLDPSLHALKLSKSCIKSRKMRENHKTSLKHPLLVIPSKKKVSFHLGFRVLLLIFVSNLRFLSGNSEIRT